MSAFGIAVDEKDRELILTVEDDSAVSTFRKTANGSEAPIRLLQGDKTLLAWPHGITHDPKTDLIYVSNWGSRSKKAAPPASVPRVGTLGRGFGKPNWPLSRAYNVPGQGELTPSSITVYRRTAEGDSAPLQVIQGPKTQLNWPAALAIDPDRGVAVDLTNQELWVTNLSNHNATVYKLSASGDTPPMPSKMRLSCLSSRPRRSSFSAVGQRRRSPRSRHQGARR